MEAGLLMYLARLIDRAIALEAIPRWSVMDDNDAELVGRRLAEFGIYWRPMP